MAAPPQIAVSATPEALAEQAALQFQLHSRASIDRNGRFAVTLSGGTTPRRMLELLASPEFSQRIDWSRVHLFWSDERCVRPDDARSNYGMVRRALIDAVAVPAPNVHRMKGELAPELGASDYCDQLGAFFGGYTAPFDLTFLGIGPDGHMASLFPHTRALTVTDQPCVANFVADNPIAPWRLTLTYSAINASKVVIFLASGVEKADIVAQLIDGPSDPARLPAQGVRPRDGSLVWLLDDAAASKIVHA